ncbi:MAG: thioredoxin-like domain-containing protein [Bacteroidota bacterium]
MKRFALQTFAFLAFLIFCCSCGKDAVFNIESSGMGYNAVVSIYPSPTSEKPLLVKSLKSKQSFKLKPSKAGYGRLVLSLKGDKSFWIYLDNGSHDIKFDKANIRNYPVVSASSAKGQEIIEYYRLESNMSKDLKDSLRLANEEMDKSTSENVVEAANNLNKWSERRDKHTVEVIKTFAKKHPTSFFTLLVIDEQGTDGPNAKALLGVIKGLDKDVKDSEQAKKLITDIERATRLEEGSKMAEISGADLSGKPFDQKVLKKVNLFICWLSYDNPSRRNNVKLVELYERYKSRDVEFISVSYDKHKKWWTTVVKDDKLTWPQYADLLGSKSPNPGNLSDFKAPYMFITDQSGVILSQDVGMKGLELELEMHLKKLAAK